MARIRARCRKSKRKTKCKSSTLKSSKEEVGEKKAKRQLKGSACIQSVRLNNKRPQKVKENGVPSPLRPPKFSWVEEGVVAGMGRPSKHGHVQYLIENGIQLLVTLTINKPRALQEYPGVGLRWVHIPVQDETPPTLQQICEFVSVVQTAQQQKPPQAVAVHCAWGRGRTGTVLACHLIAANNITADSAIAQIRTLRPGSIDTGQQANAVKEYAKHREESG